MIIRADARALPLRDGCVQCVVTSPPYFGLRDYGSSHQIGLEATPAAYVASLVQVFRDVRRVLKADGTVWLNLGDSYAANFSGNHGYHDGRANRALRLGPGVPEACKPKDLLGIPWRVAFALQADGWYLRSDIIWHKKNPMPESVTDRPTKAHEYLFLLAKSERYYYDADAIQEPLTTDERENYPSRAHIIGRGGLASLEQSGAPQQRSSGGFPPRYTGTATKDYDAAGAQDPSATKTRITDAIRDGRITGRNKRSVWTIPTMPYAGAHFATMPEALVEPCILAGAPLGALVLDPFLGSGTVGAVAERLGRRWVGTDLSYQPLSQARTAQRGLRFADDVA